MAWFASAASLHQCDFRTLLAISIGIIKNKSGPQIIC